MNKGQLCEGGAGFDAARWDARRAAVTNEQRAARLRELHI